MVCDITEADVAVGTGGPGDMCHEGKAQSETSTSSAKISCHCSIYSTKAIINLTVFSSSQDECHNFIKVLVPRNDDLVFICGTNGFNPMCRYYRVGHTVYEVYVTVWLLFCS